MFIHKFSHGGYTRDGQQRSGRGHYLALFSWNDYKALDEVRAACSGCQMAGARRRLVIGDIAIVAKLECTPECGSHSAQDICTCGLRARVTAGYEGYNLPKHCPSHSGIIHSGLPIPMYANGKGKLWACVRSCALSQCGHFMMGTIRIGGKSITVSGAIGSDGLPLDLQTVPTAYRDRLIEVPEAIAAIYWKDDGWNTIGSAGMTLRDWALTLPVTRSR